MSVYIDLSLVLLFFQGVSGLYFLKNVLLKKYHFYDYLIIGTISCLSLCNLYFYPLVIEAIYIVLILIFFSLKYRKVSIKKLLLFLFYKLFSLIIILFTFKGVKLYQYVLIISDKIGIFSLLSYPLLIIITYLATIFVDKLYRLNKFKEEVIIVINNKKYKTLAYFDSGNISTFNGNPVIFACKNKFDLDTSLFKLNGNFKTISGNKLCPLCECLIDTSAKNEYKFSYLALIDNDDFNGCDLLLNAYLF